MSRGKPSMMIPFLFNNCKMLFWMSLSRLSFVTISPVVIASLMAKFSVNGLGSDSASVLRFLPMLLRIERSEKNVWALKLNNKPYVTPSRIHSNSFHAQCCFITSRTTDYKYHLRYDRRKSLRRRWRPLVYCFHLDDFLTDVSVHFRASFNWRLDDIWRRCDYNIIFWFTLTWCSINADNTTRNIINAISDSGYTIEDGFLVFLCLKDV